MENSPAEVENNPLNVRPKISVCLACYNGQHFIGRQLESILPQLGVNDEIIISDDHSTDNTMVKIREYIDHRIKLVTNYGKKGPVGNFENALSQATGDLLFLSDQDDVWLPEKVSNTVALLQQYDLVLTDCKVVDSTLHELYPSFFLLRKSKPGFFHNILKNSYMGCCMAFRRSLLTYALPIPAHVHMHDWWIGLIGEAKGKVYFYNRPQLLYVRHGNNASPTGESSYRFTQKVYNRFMLLMALLPRLIK